MDCYVSASIPVGARVGADRWPNTGAHPDAWNPPWSGVLLALDDPRAWEGTIAFPGPDPDPSAVREHVARCLAAGYLTNRAPVLWDFGDRQRVWWETRSSLRTYAQDLEAWAKARWSAYRNEAELGLRKAA
jgi:hypothetical protein